MIVFGNAIQIQSANINAYFKILFEMIITGEKIRVFMA